MNGALVKAAQSGSRVSRRRRDVSREPWPVASMPFPAASGKPLGNRLAAAKELVFIAGEKSPIFLWRPFHPRAKARGNSARGNSNSKNVILRFVRPVSPRNPNDRNNEEAPSCLEGIPRFARNDTPRRKGFFSAKGNWNDKPDTEK